MKRIELTRGKVALVDDEDFEYLNQWSWYASPNGKHLWYAVRGIRIDSKSVTISMHRQILGVHGTRSQVVDHINGDGLDNRRSNLRFITQSQNVANGRKRKGFSRFKGVCKVYGSSAKIWGSKFWDSKQGKTIHLGSFYTEEEAARAYDDKARLVHGEFARLNFPNDFELSALSPGAA